jgi:Ras-related GTP-binding protein C/D
VLHGKPVQIKTRAQLKLEHVLQDIQRMMQANQAAQVKAGLPPNPNDNKFRDSKPRLLLMGLRRYV